MNCVRASLHRYQISARALAPTTLRRASLPSVSLSVCGLPANQGFCRSLSGCFYLHGIAIRCQGKKPVPVIGVGRSPSLSPSQGPGAELAPTPGPTALASLTVSSVAASPSRALLNKVWQQRKQTLFYNIFGCTSKMQRQLISSLPETLLNVAAAFATELGFDGSPRRRAGKW